MSERERERSDLINCLYFKYIYEIEKQSVRRVSERKNCTQMQRESDRQKERARKHKKKQNWSTCLSVCTIQSVFLAIYIYTTILSIQLYIYNTILSIQLCTYTCIHVQRLVFFRSLYSHCISILTYLSAGENGISSNYGNIVIKSPLRPSFALASCCNSF